MGLKSKELVGKRGGAAKMNMRFSRSCEASGTEQSVVER